MELQSSLASYLQTKALKCSLKAQSCMDLATLYVPPNLAHLLLSTFWVFSLSNLHTFSLHHKASIFML